MAEVALYAAVFADSAACLRLSESFYARVQQDPVLRPLFPGKSMHCAIEEFAAYLTQLLGGPAEATQRRWWISIRESHARFTIDGAKRDAWLRHMQAALDDAALSEAGRAALRHFFEHASAQLVNVAPGAAGLVEMRTPEGADPVGADPGGELARGWAAQRRLDETMAALRSSRWTDVVDALTDQSLATYLADRPSLLGQLLAAMLRTGDDVLHAYVRECLERDLHLVDAQYVGRTLLHDAAVSNDLPLVEWLLEHGADVRAGVHSPLYAVANESRSPNGGGMITTLVRAGADVDAAEGLKRCTALHLAARRGNVEVATALLDCGADLEARDSRGETALRRAVNLDRLAVAALLLSRGANPDAPDSRGLTPARAARSKAMRTLISPRP